VNKRVPVSLFTPNPINYCKLITTRMTIIVQQRKMKHKIQGHKQIARQHSWSTV